MDLPSTFRDSIAGRVHASYDNPRLKHDEVNYLSKTHIEQLRRDSEIIKWTEYAARKKIPGIGTLRRIGIKTAQGYSYDTLVGIPEKPECSIPVIGTTAWTTSLRGHNEHVVRNLVRAGNYVVYVGAEGSYITDEPSSPESPITLANSAATVLNFSHHIVNELRRDGHDVDETLRFGVAESRGGMVAEGLDSLAAAFKQDMLFSDEIAPCLPRKLQSIHDIYKFSEQIIREPKETYRLLGSLTLARLRYYPHTLDIRADCLRHQLIIGGALFSGEAGALARKRPGGTLKHLTVFENDFASMRDTWEEIYSEDPHVLITPRPGSHMTIANMTTLREVIGRNKAAQSCANSGDYFTKENIFDRAEDLAKRQYPMGPDLMNTFRKSA